MTDPDWLLDSITSHSDLCKSVQGHLDEVRIWKLLSWNLNSHTQRALSANIQLTNTF